MESHIKICPFALAAQTTDRQHFFKDTQPFIELNWQIFLKNNTTNSISIFLLITYHVKWETTI